MGFKITDKVAVLEFRGGEYEGAQARVRLNVSLGAFLEFQGTAAKALTAESPLEKTSGVREMIEAFCRIALLEWNLEDKDGVAVPATPEGALSLPLAFLQRLIEEWTGAVAEVPAPLGSRSNGGDTSLEASMELAAASRSLGS